MNQAHDQKSLPKVIGFDGRVRRLALALLLALVAAVYSNSLNAVWTFDDYPNILHNPRVQLQLLTPETLLTSVQALPAADGEELRIIDRPLSYLSFAINWYFDQNSAFSFRLVNIAIHLINTTLLFWIVIRLLCVPKFGGRFKGQEVPIAFIAASLWALNPIQTQAVVYIVQRMASMAAMFYLGTIACYILGRESGHPATRAIFWGLSFLSFVAGIASKENAILAPGALMLLEFGFYRDSRQLWVRRYYWGIIGTGLFLTATAIAWIAYRGELETTFHYGSRLFSPSERVLTQTRILLFYLSQLLWPLPSRLSLVHDVELSHSLWDPWTTLPALIGVCALVLWGLQQLLKRPLLGFAVIFFFYNHTIESSLIGLELIFEHRNYLPSLFVFLPVAVALVKIGDRLYRHKTLLGWVSAAVPLLWVGSLGVGTYARNAVWCDVKTLWEDAAAKAPASMRPLINLAYEYYERHGRYEEAYHLYMQSLSLKDYNRTGLGIVHNNIANYRYRRGDYAQAKTHLDLAVTTCPEIEHFRYFRAIVLRKSGELQAALEEMDKLRNTHPNSYLYNKTMAYFLLSDQRLEEANVLLRRSIELSPNSGEAWALLGISLALSGENEFAGEALGRADELLADHHRYRLWLIAGDLQIGMNERAFANAASLMKSTSRERIKASLQELKTELPLPAGQYESLEELINSTCKNPIFEI